MTTDKVIAMVNTMLERRKRCASATVGPCDEAGIGGGGADWSHSDPFARHRNMGCLGWEVFETLSPSQTCLDGRFCSVILVVLLAFLSVCVVDNRFLS